MRWFDWVGIFSYAACLLMTALDFDAQNPVSLLFFCIFGMIGVFWVLWRLRLVPAGWLIVPLWLALREAWAWYSFLIRDKLRERRKTRVDAFLATADEIRRRPSTGAKALQDGRPAP